MGSKNELTPPDKRQRASAKHTRDEAVCGACIVATNKARKMAFCPLHAAAADLLAAAKRIATDWRTIDPDAQVPDEINVNEHWDALHAAIAKAEEGK